MMLRIAALVYPEHKFLTNLDHVSCMIQNVRNNAKADAYFTKPHHSLNTYRVGQKSVTTNSSTQFCQILTDFQIFFHWKSLS